MKNTKYIIAIVCVATLAFWGGVYYQKQSIDQSAQNSQGRTGGNFNSGMMRGTNSPNRMSNGFVGGEVISKDENGIVVKMRDGSSRIVFVSGKTTISKSVLGATSDVVVGSDVTVTGTGNSDGSVTAQMIQIRPATSTNIR